MPRGSRPSIAALTRSGARKANEIVMLTFRLLHPSRVAILSVVAVTSVVSSSSQWRPRATDATNVARVSDRIGRSFSRWVLPAEEFHDGAWRVLSAKLCEGGSQRAATLWRA